METFSNNITNGRASVHPGEGSSSVALLKVYSRFSVCERVFGEFFLLRCEVKGQGCKVCVIIRNLWFCAVWTELNLIDFNVARGCTHACKWKPRPPLTPGLVRMRATSGKKKGKIYGLRCRVQQIGIFTPPLPSINTGTLTMYLWTGDDENPRRAYLFIPFSYAERCLAMEKKRRKKKKKKKRNRLWQMKHTKDCR